MPRPESLFSLFFRCTEGGHRPLREAEERALPPQTEEPVAPTRAVSSFDVALTRAVWSFDVADAVPLDGAFRIAASWIGPAHLQPGARVPLLVCLPGGFLSRDYFDLGSRGSRSYSFAVAMASRGFGVLTLDHLGTGESSKPAPESLGFELGVGVIAAANQRAYEGARDRLHAGDPDNGIPPIEISRSIGVGHSMGSMLSVEQQARFRPHDGLVLFSFSTAGTPRFLDETLRGYADQPRRLREEMPEVAQRTMGSPYPPRANGVEGDRRAAFGVGTAPPEAEDLLQAAATNLLAVGGITSMVPGGFAPAAQKIEVPTVMIFGEHDLHDDRSTAEELPLVRDLTTWCLEDAWHCHFVSNRRNRLWDEVQAWLVEHDTPGVPLG